ncbi:putative multicopper oxidase [Durotheca rogersii]|uniref:putative multicopper oxidase n=1 Tax=Durotheca rogersii TaxID=419775 RepID=UPI002220E551|nr:putative multicopper oxidase [Durotheca rogersii]KAI5859794.1 putative multicopper oxidase [Durotheca rogersii]
MRWYLSLLPSLVLRVGLLQTGALAATASVHDSSWQPEYVIHATFQDVVINCQHRQSVVLNGTTPGPTLHLKEGQTTWVRVYNDLPDTNLTMHWHGLTMRTAPFSDGTAAVSQWPIAPGRFFDYEIHPEIGDAGSYFYHSHIGFQAVTAHGLLIVDEDGPPPYKYDEEIPLMFSDWYVKSDREIEQGLTASPFKWSGEPVAVALNARTGTRMFPQASDVSCTPFIIDVEPGKTYRLRVVGATTLSYVHFALQGHPDLTIISADGHYSKPITTNRIQLGSGQRYDILLKTKSLKELIKDKKRGIYWLRYESRGRSKINGGYALVRYRYRSPFESLDSVLGRTPGWLPRLPVKSPVRLPADGADQILDWLEYKLEPLKPTAPFPTLAEVTRTVYITINQDIIGGSFEGGVVTGSLVWKQNNLTWTERAAQQHHLVPYLIEAYVRGRTPNYEAALANRGWDPQSRAFPARIGEVLDIVWQSNSGPTGGFEYHPMHAHGEHFWDLGAGNGTYHPATNEKRFRDFTPMRRDTTMLNRYTAKGDDHATAGWRAWRIRVTKDNVGAWMMHCHILQHMIMGMQTVWVFGDAASILREIPPPYINGYLEYGGNAYGNETYDPLVLDYFTD